MHVLLSEFVLINPRRACAERVTVVVFFYSSYGWYAVFTLNSSLTEHDLTLFPLSTERFLSVLKTKHG